MKRIAAGMSLAVAAAPLCAADLTLYADDGFQGRPLNVIIDMRQLASMNFNDRASSLVIEKDAWVVCTDEDFGGRCVTLEPGRYESLDAMGLDDTITSVKRRDSLEPGIFGDAQAAAPGTENPAPERTSRSN